jgi:hypothetical protein
LFVFVYDLSHPIFLNSLGKLQMPLNEFIPSVSKALTSHLHKSFRLYTRKEILSLLSGISQFPSDSTNVNAVDTVDDIRGDVDEGDAQQKVVYWNDLPFSLCIVLEKLITSAFQQKNDPVTEFAV